MPISRGTCKFTFTEKLQQCNKQSVPVGVSVQLKYATLKRYLHIEGN